MDRNRMEGRIQRLLDARAGAMAKMASLPAAIKDLKRRGALKPDAPEYADELFVAAKVSGMMLKHRNLEKKVADIDLSFANLEKYGQEAKPTGNPVGVQIDVPAGTFKIKAHAPEPAGQED